MTNSSDAISVMIVDDHEMVRLGACSYLEAQPDISVVAQAGSGEEAVKLAQEYIPDVVLMDLVMPGMDGVETTRRVKNISPRTQIVILTSFHQDEFIFPALQAGAISYLLKDVKAKELVDAIRRAARGEATLHPRIAARLIKTFHSLEPEESSPFTALTTTSLSPVTGFAVKATPAASGCTIRCTRRANLGTPLCPCSARYCLTCWLKAEAQHLHTALSRAWAPWTSNSVLYCPA